MKTTPNYLNETHGQSFNGTADQAGERLLFLMPRDWTWWAWGITATLLIIGQFGNPGAFVAAMVLTGVHLLIMLLREKSFTAFPVQLRLAYALMLGVCSLPGMQWLFWLPAIGTFALLIFGYCLMARMLSLLPWNRSEALSIELLLRVFTSRPRMISTAPEATHSCAGGMCTIAAQVRPRA